MRNVKNFGKIRKINFNSQINIYNPLENVYLSNSYLTPRMYYNRAFSESANFEHYPNNFYFRNMNNYYYNSLNSNSNYNVNFIKHHRPNSQDREHRYRNNINNKIFLPKQRHRFSRSLSFYDQNNIRNNYSINNIGNFNNSYGTDNNIYNNNYFFSNSFNNINNRFNSIDVSNPYNNYNNINVTGNYNYSNIINNDYNYYNNPNNLYNSTNNYFCNINDNYFNNINLKFIIWCLIATFIFHF